MALGKAAVARRFGLAKVWTPLRAVTVVCAEIGARQEMLVHANGTFVLPAAAKQVAQCKVQFGCFRIVLDSLNKRINGLILLFIEQKVQALEIRLGRLAVFHAQLPQIQARCEPAQYKRNR